MANSKSSTPETCEVCDRTAVSALKHPCRFEKACACWYGIPCSPAGASMRVMDRKRSAVNGTTGVPHKKAS